jgi:hypothetical protein
VHSHLLPPPYQPGLVSGWQVPTWSWILGTRQRRDSRTTYGCYGVAANGLTIYARVIVLYCILKRGGIVGGGGTINMRFLSSETVYFITMPLSNACKFIYLKTYLPAK